MRSGCTATLTAGKHALAVDQQARAHEMGRESHAQGLEALEAKRRAGKANGSAK